MTIIFKNATGAIVETPAGYLKRMTLAIDGDAIENPIFESHKRGKNWVAILTGKNAASMERHFLANKGRVVDVSKLSVTGGDVLEIAGDYTSTRGNKSRNRVCGVVVERTDEQMILDTYSSDAKALSAANRGIRSLEVSDDEVQPDRVWIELKKPTSDDHGEQIAAKANRMLRLLGHPDERFRWSPHEGRYLVGSPSRGEVVCADNGHWFDLDYLSMDAPLGVDGRKPYERDAA